MMRPPNFLYTQLEMLAHQCFLCFANKRRPVEYSRLRLAPSVDCFCARDSSIDMWHRFFPLCVEVVGCTFWHDLYPRFGKSLLLSKQPRCMKCTRRCTRQSFTVVCVVTGARFYPAGDYLSLAHACGVLEGFFLFRDYTADRSEKIRYGVQGGQLCSKDCILKPHLYTDEYRVIQMKQRSYVVQA